MEGISVGIGVKSEGMEKGEASLAGYGLVWDKNEISSEVENFFIPYFFTFFNLFSLDQSPIHACSVK